MTAAAETALPSPFAQAAPDLAALGFTCIPLLPHDFTQHQGRGKAPGEFRSGNWRGMSKWQRYRDSTPSQFELGLWNQWPDANIGLLMGTVARKDLHVVVLDFDAKDADALDTLLRAAPASPMVKRGQKGESRFYLAPKTLKTTSYDGPDGRLIDRLTGFDTRQTVVPPSVHPDTGHPYMWLAGPVRADELPVLTDDDIEALEEALEQCGWSRERRSNGVVREPRCGEIDPDDIWSETKAAALGNLDAWVPALDLYGLRPARGGYECVATWRASCSGRNIADRKRNLSIQRDGIKDFGTNDTYSAIDLVMKVHDCEQAEATDWLRVQLGLKDDGVSVDFSGMLASQVQRVADAAGPVEPAGPETALPVPLAVETTEQDAELPDHLTRVPGLVGQITDWIEATSRKPQRVLAMAAAIGIVGTVAGRKFAGPTDSATHLFILGIAGTGAGKNAPKKAGAALLTAAGLRSLLGPGSFMSSSGLIQHVSRNPASLCILDEFGVYLARLNAKNNSTHERAISGDLRQLWSLSFEEFHPPKWANSAQRQEMAPIISPALSIIGLSTPDEFYASLQGADIVSGFANRFLILATSKNPEDVEPTASVFDVPAQLIEGLQGIAGVGGALATATMHSLQADRPMVRVDWENGIGSAAHNVFKRLKAEIQSREGHEALMQRTAEMAVRLATIRAIGISGENAEVSADDMQWGADLALWSAERLIADVDTHLVESDHQMRAKMVLRIIKEAPGGTIGRTALCRKVNHRFDARTLDAVLLGLCDAGQVEELKDSGGGRVGRKASAYRAVK